MPISETIPRQWDVVVLPFPYADRLAEKRRPAVVISTEKLAREHGIVWVAMITSAENAGWTGDVAIGSAEAGLQAPSVIRPAKQATVDLTRVQRIIGHIDRSEITAVGGELDRILGRP